MSQEDEESYEGDDVFAIEEPETQVPARMSGTEDLQINLVDTGDTLVIQALVPGR